MRNEYLNAVHFDGFAHHDRDGLPVGDDPVVILKAVNREDKRSRR